MAGLISDNASSLPDLTVAPNKRLIKVTKDKATLLNALVHENGDLVLRKLDLRPLGLNVFSDELGLHVLDSTLTQNHFNGMPVVLAFP